MKPALLYTFFALLVVLMASSCVKDPEPTGGGGSGTSDSTTSIRFTAVKDTTVLPGVFFGITLNRADRDNGVYLFTANTNSAGWAEFRDLEANTYWYSGSYSSSGGAIVKEGSITLERNDQVKRDITF